MKTDHGRGCTANQLAINPLTHFRLTDIWTHRADVFLYHREVMQSGIFTHRAQEKYEITPHHLPVVFATLAFKLMNSCRRTRWRERHSTALPSCSTLSSRDISTQAHLAQVLWQEGSRYHTAEELSHFEWNYKKRGQFSFLNNYYCSLCMFFLASTVVE